MKPTNKPINQEIWAPTKKLAKLKEIVNRILNEEPLIDDETFNNKNKLPSRFMQFTAKSGLGLEALYEHFNKTFKGEMPEYNQFTKLVNDILNDHKSKRSMIEKLEMIQGGEIQHEQPTNNIRQVKPEVDPELAEHEFAKESIKESEIDLKECPELTSDIEDFIDDSGEVDWDVIELNLNGENGFFSGFPFNLSEDLINEVQQTVIDVEKRKIYERTCIDQFSETRL